MKKIVRFLVSAEEFLIWGLTLQMVLLTFVQVVLRYAFHSPYVFRPVDHYVHSIDFNISPTPATII